MILIGIIIGACIISAILMWCCLKVGADSDFDANNKKGDNKKWNSKD